MSAAISVDAAVKRYGSLEALGGVDLEVRQGDFFGLLGPNGAGKTTLISALAGLLRLSSGHIRIMGYDVVSDYRQARRQVGIVPQEIVFDPFFSVREVLKIQSGYFGLRDNDDWVDELLFRLDLSAKADVNMRQLSGGMKRRVLVAQALVHKPPVIVLDEPTAGVDVELRQGLWAFVRELNEAGHTIVLTTHYLEEAQSLCNRIAMLKAGRIVALDDTANLLHAVEGFTMKVKLEGEVPAELEPAGREGQYWLWSADSHEALVERLVALRAAGVRILDFELGQPDLEQVFVEVMRSAP